MVKAFGNFEFDDHRRELTVEGRPVKLTGQACDLLGMLLERPGDLMTREEIHSRLWPDTNVDFEHSLDVLVSRLRAALGEGIGNSRYIQTLPRKGYRFIERVTVRSETGTLRQPLRMIRRVGIYVAVAILVAILALLFARTRYEKFVPSGATQASPARIR